MSELVFTPEQREAIETIDRSVLVSAAAGSGKTAVLAERCAYLICEAPAEPRCDIDQLAVVTFTENAAAEMKARIRAALQNRLRRSPHDPRLRAQLARVDAARISTLHAFGLWILRRWFSPAGVDPAAVVLEARQTVLLKSETLDRLLEKLYQEDTELGRNFRRLVDDYGLGDDRELRRVLDQLAAFLDSLPDPEEWLSRCRALVTEDRHRLLHALATDLVAELEGQADYCRRAAEYIRQYLSPFVFYARLLDDAVHSLETWRAGLGGMGLASVQAAIGAYKFEAKGAPRLAKEASPELHTRRDQARQLYQQFHENLFCHRLQRSFGRFSPEEWSVGLERIAPYISILTQLVQRYRREYTQTKADAGVLDFADLERKTYELLIGRPDIVAALRRQFRHVLVDEFQDINPLQEAILRRVSREAEKGQPGNLFVVGDVKQSIYRFRLAEPGLFLARQAALTLRGSTGRCVYLQRNYRSAPHILDAVNLLFRRLLSRRLGGIEYDVSAELRPGRPPDPSDGPQAPSVELHLLQRRWTAESETETGFVDPNDPAEWSAIEREAYVIAQRIRALTPAGVTQRDGSPIGHGGIAVLLRAASYTAAPLAQMLGVLGIPACADVGGEFFSALEVRDLLALLRVLDNPRQDIPLAAVLRSPLLGGALNEDELLEMRLIDRDVPFHEAVRHYADGGPNAHLRERLVRILGRVERHRAEVRQRPLPEALWRMLHEYGYVAYIGGLPDGAARRANLLKLHDYARQFATFQKQGLHRFLGFLESLAEQGHDLDTAPSPSTSDPVVRVMSIHRSKGLEFPVVIVADLGRRFNLRDAAGRMIFDRELGLGLRVVDRGRMIEYPALSHHLVAARVHSHTRAEELRILYVAMTRAMERLILVGSADLPALRQDYALHLGSDGPLSPLTVGTAVTPLDWIVPALATLPPGAVRWETSADRDPYARQPVPPATDLDESTRTANQPVVFSVSTYDEAEMKSWRLEVSASSSEKSARQAAADLQPLPHDEPLHAPQDTVDSIWRRLGYTYPHLAAASVPAVIAATEIRKRYDWLHDPDERPGGMPERVSDATDVGDTLKHGERLAAVGDRSKPDLGIIDVKVRLGQTTPAEAGVFTHRFLQYVDLQIPPEAGALRRELQRLVDARILRACQAEAVDLEAVAWFLGTELGIRIRGSGADYRREVMFVHRQPASVIDPLAVGPRRPSRSPVEEIGDTVLVRGVIDGVLPTASGAEIVDYKTDRIPPAAVDERVRTYAPQLAAYAAAAEALFRRPVEKSWLVFLHPQRILDARCETWRVTPGQMPLDRESAEKGFSAQQEARGETRCWTRSGQD